MSMQSATRSSLLLLVGVVLAACSGSAPARPRPQARRPDPRSETRRRVLRFGIRVRLPAHRLQRHRGRPARRASPEHHGARVHRAAAARRAGRERLRHGVPGSTVNVQGGGSGTGLTQVSQGGADIGNSDISAEEKLTADQASALADHKVVKQGWVMVVNTGVTGVTGLSKQQARDLWTGAITNWKDVGGPDLPIVLVLRPASSGTRATFKKVVLDGEDEASGQALTEDSNGAVTQAVAATPGATSVIGFAYFEQNKAQLTGLALDGVEATVDNMANGSVRPLGVGHMYTKGEPTGLAKAFLDYMMSDTVQQGLVPSLLTPPFPRERDGPRDRLGRSSRPIPAPSGSRSA